MNLNDSKDRWVTLWEAKRAERLMPARVDFDVVRDLRPFLGNIILAEITSEGNDWRFRVFGTRIAASIEDDHQGKCLSEIPVEDARLLRSMFAQVVQLRRPAEFVHPIAFSSGANQYKTVMVPLSDDGVNVSSILALVVAGSRSTAQMSGPAMRHSSAMAN